ncbi:hypothetical protein B0T17DRAFT_541793 [Bombardia bombarda]|uniref:Uncharacterized protein n=1 Tax=Bombardia bombarda TaxID=252184 RepID=A0AA39TZP4_9PEZI|nr:hypothetical protein B0T17DRAFT_541793 [Bombardia bombarda]
MKEVVFEESMGLLRHPGSCVVRSFRSHLTPCIGNQQGRGRRSTALSLRAMTIRSNVEYSRQPVIYSAEAMTQSPSALSAYLIACQYLSGAGHCTGHSMLSPSQGCALVQKKD